MTERQFNRCGQRKTYQQGCRCRRCRWAEASYRSGVRKLRARGQVPRGAYVPAKATWKRLREMAPEFGGEVALAARLGLRRHELRFDPQVIRFATVERVNALYCLVMPIDLDNPYL